MGIVRRKELAYDKKDKLHIVVAIAAIRNPEGKYLVLKRHEGELVGPGLYTFPGGKAEGNQSMDETLAKEVMEEANLELLPGKIHLCDHTFVRPDKQTAKVFTYLCNARDWKKAKAGEEFTDYKWVSLQELIELPHFEIIEEYLGVAEKYLKMHGENGFSAKSIKYPKSKG